MLKRIISDTALSLCPGIPKQDMFTDSDPNGHVVTDADHLSVVF